VPDRICDVLTHLGYIEGEKPLEQGKILAKIFAESDLLLTESIRRGVFDSLTPPELLSVASAMNLPRSKFRTICTQDAE